MRAYILLILAAISMAFATGYVALFLRGPYVATEQDENTINQLKLDFQRTVDPEGVINFNSLYSSSGQIQLLNPFYAMPEPGVRDAKIKYFTDQSCFQQFGKLLNLRNFEKVWVWEEYRCNRRSSLPMGFFTTPPFMHPTGMSYAMLAFLSQKGDYQNKIWVMNHLPFFHVVELKKLRKEVGELRGIFSILEKLSDSELDRLSKGEGTILSQEFLLARLNYLGKENILEYRIYSKNKLDEFLKESPYSLYNLRKGDACFYRDGSLCWDYNLKHVFKLANSSTIILFVGLIIIVSIVVHLLIEKLKLQKQEDERRRFALRVLTHEFRTPVASLLLLIERLNKKISELDEDSQETFLRISSEVFRLQRLVEMSKNYLKAEQKQGVLKFSLAEIPSVNEFILEMIAPYEELYPNSINFKGLEHDRSFRGDIYWLSIVIKNLIENALTHGKPPVEIEITMEKESLLLKVVDHGECLFEGLDEMTKEFVKGNKSSGSGLGLNIVSSIIEEMGGTLKFKPRPHTQFLLEIPEMKGAL
ncbi:MAG: sensor histidine kinase [Bdellovibrio sp.]